MKADEKQFREAWPDRSVDLTRCEEIVERSGGEANADLTEKWVRK